LSANKRKSTPIKTKALTGYSAPQAHKQNICVHLRLFAEKMLFAFRKFLCRYPTSVSLQQK